VRPLRWGLIAAVFTSGGQLGAQKRPELFGTWIVADSGATPSVAAVGDAAFRMGNMGSGWGSPLTLAQHGDSLIVQYELFSSYDLQPPIRFAYPLDGSETRNRVNIGHTEVVQRGRITWQGNTLVITTLHPLPEGAGTDEVRQAITLASPTSLVVETTRAGVMGGPSTTTRTTYARR
jgi:hypothetical protein